MKDCVRQWQAKEALLPFMTSLGMMLGCIQQMPAYHNALCEAANTGAKLGAMLLQLERTAGASEAATGIRIQMTQSKCTGWGWKH